MRIIWMLTSLLIGMDIAAAEKLRFTLEGGAVYQTVNDVEIPRDTGTRFSLVDAIGQGPLPYARIDVRYTITPSHRLRMMLAPFSVEANGRPRQTILYNGKTFSAGADTTYRYQFSSYRLSYAWRFYQSAKWSWDMGLTGKIRHADIALTQGSTKTNYPDLGFVPLLHFAGEWQLAPRWGVQTDLDTVWSKYGRATDLGLFAQYKLNQRWQIGAGYRTVEGGADIDLLYNFAWLHYVGLRLQVNY